MGIKERLATHDARFIEFNELLKAIAEAEGVTLYDAARAWRLEPKLSGLKAVLRRHDTGDIDRGGDDAVRYQLLRAASDWGDKLPLTESVETAYRDGEPGFYRDEVAQALRAAGLSVPECVGAYDPQPTPTAAPATTPPAPAPRDALLPYVPRVWITIDDAAAILLSANGGSLDSWIGALEDAADSGVIQCNTWSMNRGEQPLLHADIRAWCAASSIEWPVPLPPSAMPGTDSELRAELEKTRKDLEAAHARIAELESPADEWTQHDTRLFKLLPKVLELAKAEPSWPKKDAFVDDLRARFGLSRAEAEALDALTRPDALRGK